MKITVIGLGFVGLSLATVLASKNFSVIGIDSDKNKISIIRNGKIPFYEPRLDVFLKKTLKRKLIVSSDISLIKDCKLIFVAVGTPSRNDGSIDLRIIQSAVTEIGKMLAQMENRPIILIKSTVIPGTTEKKILPILEKKSRKKVGKDFGLITNPEFLRETKAVEDTLHPHVIVLGGKNNKFLKFIKKFYSRLHSNVPIISTNHQTAEMIKYANNSFLATKISFINQIARICEAVPGSNVDDIARAIGLDPRIGSLFLNAGPGYGGSCLPKDIKAIINFSSRIGVSSPLLDAVESINDNQLLKIISIIKKKISPIKGKRIAVLGLAFKPDTDDVRDSVSLRLIELLLKNKVNVIVHDPKAVENTKAIFDSKIHYARSIKDALHGSNCAIIMTAWKQYKNLNNEDFKSMKKRMIVDGRRILVEKELNAEYYAVGIGR